MPGSLAGVFVPEGLAEQPDRLFIAEGPTDTAALLSLGVDAIGRPAASGAIETICSTVNRLKPSECVVVADRDEIGQRSASDLCTRLLRWCGGVRKVAPPRGSKDIRDWVITGGNLSELSELVDRSRLEKLVLARGHES
jgi:hypothetical protein